MRRFIFASHHNLAYGLKDTVDFLTNNAKCIYDINAYLSDNEKEIDIVVKELFTAFNQEDEVIVLTDLMGGSVYQKFFPYANDNVHIICGMNLPLAMSLVLASEDTKFTAAEIEKLVKDAKNQIVYVNQINSSIDCDDE